MASQVEKINELLTPVIEAAGYELYDLDIITESGRRTLRVFIDNRETGISIDDCEKIYRIIDPVLDEADPIPTAYDLQVSSPGLDRKLSKPEHFERFIGEKVTIKLYAALDGRKNFKATLAEISPDAQRITILVPQDGKSNEEAQEKDEQRIEKKIELERTQVASCRLVI